MYLIDTQVMTAVLVAVMGVRGHWHYVIVRVPFRHHVRQIVALRRFLVGRPKLATGIAIWPEASVKKKTIAQFYAK